MFRQYLAHLQDSLPFNVSLVSRAFIGFSSIQYFVSILRTTRILISLPITLVYCPLLGFQFICLLRLFFAHSQDSPALDCYLSMLRSVRIVFHSIATPVSRALSGFYFILFLPQYLMHSQDSRCMFCLIGAFLFTSSYSCTTAL